MKKSKSREDSGVSIDLRHDDLVKLKRARPIAISMRVKNVETDDDGMITVTCESGSRIHSITMRMEEHAPDVGDYLTVTLRWRKMQEDADTQYTNHKFWRKYG